MARCVETGRGPQGSVFVCETCKGDVTVKAVKAAGEWYITAFIGGEAPVITVPATHRRGPRFTKMIEEWIDYVTGCNGQG